MRADAHGQDAEREESTQIDLRPGGEGRRISGAGGHSPRTPKSGEPSLAAWAADPQDFLRAEPTPKNGNSALGLVGDVGEHVENCGFRLIVIARIAAS